MWPVVWYADGEPLIIPSVRPRDACPQYSAPRQRQVGTSVSPTQSVVGEINGHLEMPDRHMIILV